MGRIFSFMNIKTTRLKRWLLPCFILSSLVTKAQQPFGAGNLVVERIGDGTAALSSAAAAVFLDEYTPSGTLVQSIAMPTATSGSNHMLTESGSATSDGYLHLSPNGKYLAVPGYDATVGTTSVASTASATVNRVVGIVNSQGVVATTAAFSNIATGNNLRSAITTDSVNIWAGSGSSGGVYYGTAASATAVNLSTTSTNVRAINIFNGQLYTSSSSGALRIAAVGTGLPTVAGQTIVNLPGMPTSGGSPYDFTMITLSNGNSIIYVADDGAGILKYSNVAGTWTANGSVGTGSDGYRGITAAVRNDTAFIYAATAAKMVAVVDGNGFNTAISSANTTLTTIATAGTNKVFRGIAFAPQCAAPTITAAPTAQSTCVGGNATFTVTASGTNLGYQWMKNGTAISGASTNTYTITGATAADAGNYSVAVTACATTTTTPVALTVNALPAATITPAGSTAICTGGSVALNANTGTGLTYQWSNGTNISGATNASYTATVAGSYTVTVSNGSCAATSTATTVTVNPAPIATITAATATTFCSGGSVVLNANTGTGLTYQWSNGTNISGATNASYTATAAGNYTVTVSNGSCAATSTATTVTVNPAPTATITAGGSTNLCSGGSVVLNANTGTGLTYVWKNGTTTISGATAASYTANAAGSYTVTVSNGTCSATSAATTVNVLTGAGATITPAGNTTFCNGGSVVLNANTGTGLTYQWSNGTNISGATSASYTATTAGVYTVTVSNGSCNATSTATTVTVNPVPAATITAGGATTFCAGGSVTLNANTGSGLTYQWQNGANTIAGATAGIYNATATGSYTVTVSNGSCNATSTVTTVTVNALPAAAITAATDTTFCAGDSVKLNANTGTGFTYQWVNGSINIAGATNASYTANAAGVYLVNVTNAGCTAASNTKTITVNALPTATVTPATATTFCAGGSVVLNANTGTGLTYQWKQNGTAIAGATANNYTAVANGSYTVTVANANNCKATATAQTVVVNPLPTATIAVSGMTLSVGSFSTYQWYKNNQAITGATAQTYTVTQNGIYYAAVTDNNGCVNNSNTVNITNLGVETVNSSKNAVTVYPNPAQEVVYIKAPVAVNVTIRNINGQIVFAENNVHSADISKLANGLYMIFVADEKGQLLLTEKLMKNP